MYNPNVLASIIINARRPSRSLTSDDRKTLVALLPELDGMVWCLVTLALRYYSIEVA